jgi:L-methionine (R)-S-oxide reductase
MIEIEKIKRKLIEILNDFSNRDDILFEISRMLKNEVFHYDWVGFYILDETEKGLILGPYSGAETEHTYIPVGKGVCGQVAQHKSSMVVQDVSQIENYLSCSINVQSEVVFPVLKCGKFVAELDIDSHSPAPFTENDTKLLELVCSQLSVLF